MVVCMHFKWIGEEAREFLMWEETMERFIGIARLSEQVVRNSVFQLGIK